MMPPITSHISAAFMSLLLLASTPAWGQKDTCRNELNFGLNFMTHGEIRGGGLPRDFESGALPEDNAGFMMGRTRISVDYKNSSWLMARATAQNLAVWGARGNTALNLYEGWVKLVEPHGLFAQVGRMPLSYDDERILGPNDWAMTALSHDVLRVGYEGHGHKIHGILAYNQNGENITTGTYYKDGSQYYKTMQTLWYHFDVPKIPIGASVLFMNIGMQAGTPENNPHTEYQQMLGTYITYSPLFFKFEGSYYRQMGHDEMETRIEAWMASGKITATPSERYSVSMGYDYLSGDDYVPVVQPGTIGLPYHGVLRGFTPIYGSHHKFYGIMDYFYRSAYIQGFTPGLQNLYIGGRYKPLPPLSVSATYHYLATTTKLDNLGMTLGHDVDLEVSYSFSKDVSLVAGFSYMAGTETMNRLKQGNTNKSVRWGWFSLIVSPRLFTTKW